jgi:hypothetical protein
MFQLRFRCIEEQEETVQMGIIGKSNSLHCTVNLFVTMSPFNNTLSMKQLATCAITDGGAITNGGNSDSYLRVYYSTFSKYFRWNGFLMVFELISAMKLWVSIRKSESSLLCFLTNSAKSE